MDFILRPWRTEDAADIVPHANDPAVSGNLRDVFPYPYTLADAEDYISACVANEGKGQLCRAIVVDGRAAGSIGVFLGRDVYRRSAELGYWLGRAYWRQGIMSAAVKALCREAFQSLDIVRVYAEPFAGNVGSRYVLEKAGFTLEGVLRKSVYKNGVLMDSCIYAKLREEAAT